MLDFNDFFYFVQVVDRGGFTAAGRTLRIPKSTLSHRIQQLEANLGVRLLNRTSRRFGIAVRSVLIKHRLIRGDGFADGVQFRPRRLVGIFGCRQAPKLH